MSAHPVSYTHLDVYKRQFHKIKEMKNFISANTTKEAYRYGKRMIIKLLRHIFPRRIKAELHFGFEQPDATGKMLGYMGMRCV